MLIFSFFFRHVPTHMYLRTRSEHEGNHEKYGGWKRILDGVLLFLQYCGGFLTNV